MTTPRGSVLLAVLIVVTMGALAASTTLFLSRSTQRAGVLERRGVERRAAVCSAIEAMVSELEAQRDDLFDGVPPELPDALTLFEQGERRAVVRLVEIDGQRIIAEPAKLDVNHATEEMLEAIEGIDAPLAGRIVEERSRRPFRSLVDLQRVEGNTPEILGLMGDASLPSGFPTAQATLSSLLTVHAFDPNVQSGIGADASQYVGRRRINLNREWSDGMAQAIAERYDEDIANSVRGLIEGGRRFRAPSDIVRVLIEFNVGPVDWSELLDVFSCEAGPFQFGRVDLNTAPGPVLAAIPGISQEAAERIVAAREGLDAQTRRGIAWPVMEQIVSVEDFALAVDHLTTRSMQWRMRLETGYEREQPESGEEPMPLEARSVTDIIIDLAAPRPRVALIRDVTYLPVARMLAGRQAAADAAVAPRVVESERARSDEPVASDSIDEVSDPPASASTPDVPPAEPPQDESDNGDDEDRRLGRWTNGGAAR
jgi:DNA uptake protein ComE-like DNA-binding protein